jgi:hypothetical protein
MTSKTTNKFSSEVRARAVRPACVGRRFQRPRRARDTRAEPAQKVDVIDEVTQIAASRPRAAAVFKPLPAHQGSDKASEWCSRLAARIAYSGREGQHFR